MEAIFKFNMDRPQDIVEFQMATKGRAYLDALFNIGYNLRRIREEGGDINEALETYNEAMRSIGVVSINNEDDIYED
jgi:hypothetical protein